MTKNPLDKRLNVYRSDLADIALKQNIKADKYVSAKKYQVATGLSPLYNAPDQSLPLASQLLYGEYFKVFEIKDGWAWGQSDHDGYVGYCLLNTLTPDLHKNTHHVSALSTHLYSEPNFKSKPVDCLHMMSNVSAIDERQTKGFIPLADGNWVYATHIAKDYGSNPVSEALKFLYTPYLWGGKSNNGIDCSGLIQTGFAAVGITVPRDSDLQEKQIGITLDDDETPQQGDVAFFPGHVGFMIDDMHLLHANAHHMRVSIDPLRDVIDIVSFQTDKPPLSCIKRLYLTD